MNAGDSWAAGLSWAREHPGPEPTTHMPTRQPPAPQPAALKPTGEPQPPAVQVVTSKHKAPPCIKAPPICKAQPALAEPPPSKSSTKSPATTIVVALRHLGRVQREEWQLCCPCPDWIRTVRVVHFNQRPPAIKELAWRVAVPYWCVGRKSDVTTAPHSRVGGKPHQ